MFTFAVSSESHQKSERHDAIKKIIAQQIQRVKSSHQAHQIVAEILSDWRHTKYKYKCPSCVQVDFCTFECTWTRFGVFFLFAYIVVYCTFTHTNSPAVSNFYHTCIQSVIHLDFVFNEKN